MLRSAITTTETALLIALIVVGAFAAVVSVTWLRSAERTMPSTGVPFLRGSAVNSSEAFSESYSISCGLGGTVAGDLLFAIVRSTGLPDVNITASDPALNSYSYLPDLGAGFVPSGRIDGVYSQARTSGPLTITVRLGHSEILSIICYDIAGVQASPTISIGGGSNISLSTSSLAVRPNSFVVGFYQVNSGSTFGSFTPGNGFSTVNGTPLAPGLGGLHLESEYEVSQSGNTACPMSISANPPFGWAGVCFAFPSGT